MPVYLCKPGFFAAEPWRHGIQVYAHPFDIDQYNNSSSSSAGTANNPRSDATPGPLRDGTPSTVRSGSGVLPLHYAPTNTTSNAPSSVVTARTAAPRSDPSAAMVTIRRIRHSEVVLVDDVCHAYGHYWLRLRWPGKGGFAGYIALVSEGSQPPMCKPTSENENATASTMMTAAQILPIAGAQSEGGADTPVLPAPGYYTADADVQSLRCLRTGLLFPSSPAMQLLETYDDGITPPVALPPPSEGNPVFCRICREGIHEVEDDEPSPQKENEDDNNNTSSHNMRSQLTIESTDSLVRKEEDETGEDASLVACDPTDAVSTIGPVQPHPTYSPNQAAAENPLLAPCECAGSMAFVHYLCVEQWRCRSRHPAARNGLNCETCGKPYALPPPSSRPVPTAHVALDEDWLEAMPPHVMAALRQPHLWWQIGANIVRRRWLRPLAPVFMSPLVALYCRARRLLKKRGVSRRRWACSLCRRRARWKCVRCLRSYYCSRQCQNVSWHIVHKHVCYKPARFWSSVSVYGSLIILAVPGLLRDPFVYDFAAGFIPVSFFVMAVLGGSTATFLKRSFGIDLRGRVLELVVVLSTGWLVWVCWRMIWAFFGKEHQCVGVVSGLEHQRLLDVVYHLVLRPGETYFLLVDRFFGNTVVHPWICANNGKPGCFPHLPGARADNLMESGKCRSDLTLLHWLWATAGASLAITTLWKKRRRAARPHQD